MGFTHDRGRRPRRGGSDRRERCRTPVRGRAVRHHASRRRAARGPVATPIEDRLRILHKLDQVGFPYIEGGWPGANPRDTEFFKLATKETLAARAAHRVRHDARGGRARRGLRRAPRPARRRHRGRLPGRQVVGPARHRGAAHRPRRGRRHGARLGRVPACPGPAGVLRRRALLRRVPANPAFAMGVLARGEEAGAERLVLCDTNGGMLPFDVARIVREVAAGGVGKLGIHVHNDAGCAVANSLIAVDAGVHPGPGHDQRVRRAHRQRRPRPDHRRPRVEDGHDGRPARGRGGAPHRARALRGRDRERDARLAPARTRVATRSRTRRACTRAASPACTEAYEHVDARVRRQPPRRRGERPRRRARPCA